MAGFRDICCDICDKSPTFNSFTCTPVTQCSVYIYMWRDELKRKPCKNFYLYSVY